MSNRSILDIVLLSVRIRDDNLRGINVPKTDLIRLKRQQDLFGSFKNVFSFISVVLTELKRGLANEITTWPRDPN